MSGNYKSKNASFFNYSILFDVLIETVNGGKIVIEDNSFKIGDKVTVKVKPEDGYVLGAIGGIEVSKVDDETYTFIMPAEDVTLTPKFVMDDAINNIDGPIPNPETGGFVGLMLLILILIGIIIFKCVKNKKFYKI